MNLRPCEACSRHVRVEEAACPFCGATLVASEPRRVTLVGRASRAMVFASATVAGACWSGGGKDVKQPDDIKQVETPKPVVGPPQAGKATLHGVVTDGASGQPMASWSVELVTPNGESRRAVADANGHYVFADLDPGEYRIVFGESSHPRMAPPMQGASLQEGQIVQVDHAIQPTPVDNGPCCKPYGAPPARRRVV